jgi:putative spermidine/putrescine transport system permease protein
MHAVGLLIVFYIVFPLFIILSVSFTDASYLSFPPKGFTLKWYYGIFSNMSYIQSISTSAYLALASGGLALLLGVPCAYGIAHSRFAGGRALTSFFLSPLMVPGIVVGIATLQQASMLGILRTFTALVIGHVVITLPYVVRSVIVSLSHFPQNMEEAARDLGAGAFDTFVHITLPVIKPGVISGGLFAVIISWINVEVSIFGSTPSLIPIPVKLFNYVQYNVDPSIAAVSGASIFVALMIVTILDIMVGVERATLSRAAK